MNKLIRNIPDSTYQIISAKAGAAMMGVESYIRQLIISDAAIERDDVSLDLLLLQSRDTAKERERLLAALSANAQESKRLEDELLQTVKQMVAEKEQTNGTQITH